MADIFPGGEDSSRGTLDCAAWSLSSR